MFDKIKRKVWKNHSNNQKLVTIPSSSSINEGDYVEIKKINGGDIMKKAGVGLAVVLVGIALSFGLLGTSPNAVAQEDGVQYENVIEVTQTRDGEVVNRETVHNTVVNDGLNYIRDYLGEGSTGAAMDVLTLGEDCTGEPEEGDSSMDDFCTDEIEASGLERTGGSYNSNGDGNWSISNQFTAGEDQDNVNGAALFNDDSADSGTMFAGNTFSEVDLLENDQLTVNYTIAVVNG
ncbi:MAG: hypothetical protein ACOCQD_01785 [archaeon]